MRLGPMHPRHAEQIRRILGVPDDFPLTEQDVWDAMTGRTDPILRQARMPQTGGRWRFLIGAGEWAADGADPYDKATWRVPWHELEDPGLVAGQEWRCVTHVEHTWDESTVPDRAMIRFTQGRMHTKVIVGPFKESHRVELAVQLFSGLYVTLWVAGVSDDGTLMQRIDCPRAKVTVAEVPGADEWRMLVIEPTSRDGYGPVMQLRNIDRSDRPVSPYPTYQPDPALVEQVARVFDVPMHMLDGRGRARD